jgi:hypothetical protein
VVNQKTEPDSILTETELTEIFNVSVNDIEELKAKDNEIKQNLTGGWDAYRFLPYAEIGNKKIFLKQDVEKWISYQSPSPK